MPEYEREIAAHLERAEQSIDAAGQLAAMASMTSRPRVRTMRRSMPQRPRY